ncbi:MAG: NAD(P)H-dependent oxidoreductase subunit E [bacterium]|nr:NAD(P)H-dependent oxidoreductase subunit E [bacterium]
MEFTEENKKEIQGILKKYPEGAVGRQAALLPVLHLTQKQFGYVSGEGIQLVARTLDLSEAHVFGVATFYSMYHKKPVGKYHLQVCVNLSCCMEGSEKILCHLKERLGIEAGEKTTDGRFSLEEVECLASCGSGPVIQVNETYHENIKTPEKVDELLESLK